MNESSTGVLKHGHQRVWLEPEHRILMAGFEGGAELDVEDARASTRMMIELTGGEARPLLVDFSNLKSQTKGCREYYAKDPDHVKTYSAVAILVSNPLSRIIANFFLGINKPVKPTRLFDDEQQAVEWLRQYS